MILRLDSGKSVALWVIALSAILLPTRAQTIPQAGTTLLTNAIQVRALDQKEAARHFPVHLCASARRKPEEI
jgi:hypothetical protein